MNAIVVYESIYGNTRAVAEAVADGLGGGRGAASARRGESRSDRGAIGGRRADSHARAGHDAQPPDGG
jgi:hypothetical protein